MLVKTVKDLAAVHGLSGEDEMTLLAYHALLGYEKAMDRLIDQLNVTPLRPPMFKPPSFEV